MADDKEVEKTIAEDLVVTKYKLAGQIVNRKFLCKSNIYFEIAICIPVKILRSMYVGWTDGRVSSPCGQCGVAICAKLF